MYRRPRSIAVLAVAPFAVALCLSPFSPARAGEIGWLEDYSLAADKTVPLRQLIPGTEDYYYYYCLYYQSSEQWQKADATLKAWVARYNYTPRAIEVENRQALLTYRQNHERALALITNRLNLQFNHQREELNQKPNLPTKLNPAIISRERLNQQAFNQFPNTLQGFEDAALDWLVGVDLNGEQRRQLLSRLQRPDYPNLVKLIVADFNYPNSGGFGQWEIHRRLLLSQLDELVKLRPELRNQQNFVDAYIARLHSSDDVNWRQDKRALGDYLDRLWGFAKTLDPAHNSLKAHVLYQQLWLDRSQGKYDPARFLEYIKLPKNTSYISPKFMEPLERRQFAANLQQDFTPTTMLAPVGDDEPLVRSYLEHFFVDANDYSAYTPYINDQYLKEVFAETKIVNGLGDGEKLYSMLPPEKYQQLKERIDIDFAFTNKTELAPDDAVSLDVFVKNVDTLIVKVFEINTQNFYHENLREIGPDINLDGLVANNEKTYTYKEPALKRVKRHFEFPSLDHRGVYVIDFIGNGKASRALVHKGKLQFLVRTSVAGQIFKVLDEQNKLVRDATLWLAGTLYSPDKEGEIVVPFSNQPGRQPIVLSLGGFSSLDYFQQEAEEYSLAAAMYVDREELIARRKAQLIVRPRLWLNGTPVTRKSLEDVRLLITSTDLDGVASTREAADFKLFDDRETVYEFQVPQRLAKIDFTLKAKIQNQSRNQKIDLAAMQGFSINEVDRTDKTEDLHFTRINDDYLIELFGKTGESWADRPVQVQLKMRDYTQPVYASLQTDARGRALLGPLPGVVAVTATSPEGVSHTWPIRHNEHSYSQTIQGEAGTPIEIPYMGTKAKPDRSELSLLELRGDRFIYDRFENISIKNGLLMIDKLPPGDYSLMFKEPARQIHIRLTEGVRREGYVLGDYRKLETPNVHPLQIKSVDVTKTAIRIELENARPLVRVHVFGARFEPAFSAYGSMAGIAWPEPYAILTPRAESQYVAGRNIGDEYRYIIDRKFAHKYPGNMLERPSLLLNPWAIRSTETGQQVAAEGEAFRGEAKAGASAGGRAAAGSAAAPAQADYADLDFLAESSLVVANVLPDKNGVIELKRTDLGAHQELLFVAVDPENTASRIVTLPDPKADFLDLRLAKGLDPKQHFTQQKRISILAAGEKLVIPDITSTHFEEYDNLSRVFALYKALNNDTKLADFGFIRDWPSLKTDEKRALYLKYASHEMHLFLYKKDPEFFKTAIRPYLANKKEKQFIDHWLLDDDLSDYLKPWNFEQLNTFERILLAERVKGQQSIVARLVKDQFDLLPPDPDRFNMLFQTALKGSSLDTGDALGLRKAQEEAERVKTLSRSEAAFVQAADQPAGGAMAGLAVNAPALAAPSASPESPADKTPQFAAGVQTASKRLAIEYRTRGALRDMSEAKDAKQAVDFFADDRAKLGRVQQYYRKLDKTMEWVESNYYKLPLDQETAALITANPFWRDVAAHDAEKSLFSTNMAEATHNFPEMLAALALLDLPFKAAEHKSQFKGTQMTLTAGGPMIVYHEEIQPASKVADHAPILVSQNFFRNGDRFRQENGEQIDKFVNEEFLVNVVYGCQIVVTNPTSSKKKIDVLLQIPTGALAVSGGQYTKSVHLDLDPYHTQTLEYYFYFPFAGKFAHYPVQVAGNGEVLAFAEPFIFNVVRQLTNIDKQSWDYISQYGSEDDVLGFLKTENVLRVNLDRIAWRMHGKAFFDKVIALLSARHIYNNTLWSYGVKHNDVATIRQFLQFATPLVQQCGDWLDSPLVTIDPIARHSYEHMDYKPLVNARVGQLGRKREILNDRFLAQYERLLKIFSYRRQLDSAEMMSVVYYLLLQDRVEEALDFFGHVDADQLTTRLQYDYFAAYLDFYKSEPKQARQIAAKYADYPVDRWRNAFTNIVNQVDEIGKATVKVVDKEERTQIQTHEAAATPSFSFGVESKRVKIAYQNLKRVQVNYYQMDIELLFSRNPFVQGDSKQFANILPNQTETIDLPEKDSTFEFPLPEKLATSNLLIEITGAGGTQSRAYYSNALGVQTVENYGQLRVNLDGDGSPLPKVYVKVYARMKDGAVKFYKDGYTDLRGYFDYTSLNTNELDFVDRFSILILSEAHGAVVREAGPPKR